MTCVISRFPVFLTRFRLTPNLIRGSASLRSKSTMRFVQFTLNENPNVRLGVELKNGGDIVDLTASTKLPNTLVEFLLNAEENTKLAKNLVNESKNILKRATGAVTLLSPVTGPSKILCCGQNYLDHCLEQNVEPPKVPLLFNKFPSVIVGPDAAVRYPEGISEKFDWEVELAIIISKEGRDIQVKDALDHVFGFTVANDLTARDLQSKNGNQWIMAKSLDTACPLGPAVVTKESLDFSNLKLRLKVNDVVKQKSSTKQLIHKVPELIAFASRYFTLYPGDVFLTGTPPGVGCFRNPPEFLQKGDLVECEIQNIGVLRNTVQ